MVVLHVSVVSFASFSSASPSLPLKRFILDPVSMPATDRVRDLSSRLSSIFSTLFVVLRNAEMQYSLAPRDLNVSEGSFDESKVSSCLAKFVALFNSKACS